MSKKKKKQNKEQTVVEEQQAPASELTPEQIEAEVDEIVATPKRERVWEIDFVRGLMILFVVWDHFMWDINQIGGEYKTKLFTWLYELSERYYDGALRSVTHDTFVTMFVFTSGVSCSLSRSNGKRALKMMIFAVAISAATFAVSSIIGVELTIYFNVIHVIALSVAFYSAIEWIWARCTKNWQKNVFGVAMFAITMTVLVVGYCAKEMSNTHWTDLLFGKSEWRSEVVQKFRFGGDYLAFFPDFGWFLVGAFLGRIMYKEPKTVFPSVDARYVSPVTFCGRYSLWVYLISQIVMFSFVYLLHDMFNLL